MSITSLDGKRFAEMILSGANQLSANAEMVDALNVFPVPDGDTGTNMKLSITSGSKEAQANKQDHIGNVGAAFAKGLLMGARGNSGVILSQLFRGFSKDIENKSSINAVEFAQALEKGMETAYKAVMKPVEGTILTVAKDAANAAVKAAGTTDDLIAIMQETLDEAKRSLGRTPDLLPVLKEVGVVDSGGQGLVCVYEGFLAALTGKEIPGAAPVAPSMEELVSAQHHQSVHGFMNTEDIKFGYCTEFMVRFESGKRPYSEDEFRSDLSQYGDSLLVISDDDVAKVHIHSEQPGEVLSYGQQYGPLIHMKIENMREQHSALTNERPAGQAPIPVKERQEYAILAVSMGDGVGQLLKSIGASATIEGGQTMNPSTEDIMEAVKAANAKNVIILPNNKNIIMAAEQAAEIAEENVIVIPSKTIPQGMAAILAFNPTAPQEKNREGMTEAMEEVKTGQVTYAVRDTVIDGVKITKDDYMGIADGKIVTSGPELIETAKSLLQEMIDEDSEILTILFGEGAEESEVERLADFAEQNFEDVEVEVHDGGQPVYNFIFSVE
ncbi:DAK2 domain-containing protein [Siminovitchia acidinfaciens]|uniref:DAK2 domain-containing protein n=1 Tax=Siminovitchia acidinfaciens TaxID=2321395 RepID=A0A429Y2H5_9BACI|nr:DAK2 domain-containing protein [Siminovitchia acidinfaciens]RST75452.1 DAK2 domain-containing protein [Siminovitchia acidinfaciens]